VERLVWGSINVSKVFAASLSAAPSAYALGEIVWAGVVIVK